MFIIVTVENQGDYSETFNVTAYANVTVIHTFADLTLAGGNSTTLTFIWDATGFKIGNYTISAYVSPVPSESDIADNEFSDGMVQVTIPGDVNGDGGVDITDLSMVAMAYGRFDGEPGFDPEVDINADGLVEIRDVVVVARHFGDMA